MRLERGYIASVERSKKGKPQNEEGELMTMKKIFAMCMTVALVLALMSVCAATPNELGKPHANYPFVGDYTPPEGSEILKGTVIGAETGWDGNPALGASAAFNGNLGDCYDQRVTGDVVNEYPGMMMDEPYILTAARVLPTTDADWQAQRMKGAAVQGSNDGVEWTTLYYFNTAATVGSTDFVTVTEFGHNTGYTMFRYCNIEGGHTDCRELEFYGYPADSGPIPEDGEVPNEPEIDALEAQMKALTYTDETIASQSLGYRLYVPESYSADKTYSLLLYLHGSGERGNDNKRQIADVDQSYLIRRIINDEPLRENFIIVAPQCPGDDKWVNYQDHLPGTYVLNETPQTQSSKLVMSLLQKELTVSYSVDPDRIYVSGISMGGFGTWDLLCRYPDYFAAAIPVCGGLDVTCAETIKHIPIWTFHSDDDTIVLPVGTQSMVQALQDMGSDITYTKTDPWGHGAWTPAYQEAELLAWLTSKTRVEREESSESTAVSTEELGTTVGETSHAASESLPVTEGSDAVTEDGDSASSKETIAVIAVALAAMICVAVVIWYKKRK